MSQITREDLFIKIGTTPGTTPGGTAYVDASLAGWTYSVERRQTFGTMQPSVDYAQDAEGGWHLITEDDKTQLDEIFVIHFIANIPPNLPPISTSGITNGFNIGKIYNALQGRIGWIQPTVAGSPILNGFNLASTSGRWYNDGGFHASLTVQNIYDSQEDDDISDENFNSILTRMDQTTIMRCINAVFNKPQLIEKSLIYERTSNIRNVSIPNQGNFCGYRVKVSNGDWAAMINSVGLFFNGVATFNLYLYNDLIKAPLLTKSVTTVANSQTIVQLDWQLNYVEQANKGGLFYIGYFQEDLPEGVNAVDEQLNLWADTKIFGAFPFQAPKLDGLDFNRINPSVVFRTYGMNLEISAFKDYTETIVQNANMFDEARGLVMAILAIDLVRNSSRTNAKQRQSAEQLKALNVDMDLAFPTKDFPFVSGLRSQLQRELKRINCNFFPEAQPMSVPISSGNDYNFAYDTFDIKNLPPREQFY